jgi:hypothetical protein
MQVKCDGEYNGFVRRIFGCRAGKKTMFVASTPTSFIINTLLFCGRTVTPKKGDGKGVLREWKRTSWGSDSGTKVLLV